MACKPAVGGTTSRMQDPLRECGGNNISRGSSRAWWYGPSERRMNAALARDCSLPQQTQPTSSSSTLPPSHLTPKPR